MKYVTIFTMVLGFQAWAGNRVSEKPFYGEDFKAQSAVTLDNVVSDFDQYAKKDVVMEASVLKVCAKKGCWMTLQGSDKTFRVKFHEYSYFVPLSLQGKKVWVNGEINREEISIKDTKHYLEDAGASKEEIAAVTKPSFEYSIIAKGVKVIKK